MSSRDASSSLPVADPPAGAEIVARALRILALSLAPLLVIPLAHNLLHGRMLAAALIAAQEVIIAATILLSRAGHVPLAARLFTLGGWTLAFGLASFAGDGTRDVVLFALAPILLAAGVLVGRRFLWVLTAATIAALALLWVAEARGWLVRAPGPPPEATTLLDAAVILIMTATATAVLTGDFRRALERERRNAEALERSELRFRTAIELAADGILLADADAVVTEANTCACDLLDRTRARLVGRPLFELLPAEPAGAEADFRARLDRGEVVTGERTIQRPGRPDLVVETTWQRLPDRSHQCFLRDISARRRLEEQLRHAQKMEAVGALAGGIAHDFNNLITVMKGFLEMIEGDPALTAELAAHVAELRGASTHAADLTQQLLAFAGRRPLQRRTADVQALLTANQRFVSRLVGDGIEVAVEPAAQPCPVSVDPALFVQVLLNLAANARDAMPGGGRLTLATIAPAARTPPRLGREGFVVRDFTGIRVTDTGMGMAPEVARRIFEPFFTTKDTGKGTGLGLAMVHGIVERHGGWVEVESAPGRGTEFRVFLPVHVPSPDHPAPAAPANRGPAPAGQATILIVDDDPGIRRLARDALVPLGYRVIEADSGPDALAAWEESGGRLDLVFSDLVMPGGMNGIQLIDACRARQRDVAAILTSGYTLPASGSSAGVILLPKPYENAVLVDTVERALAARRAGEGAAPRD